MPDFANLPAAPGGVVFTDQLLLVRPAMNGGTPVPYFASPAGLAGAPGAAGASFRTGVGVPAASLGNNGDSYGELATGVVYAKTGGAWVSTGNSLKTITYGTTAGTAAQGNDPRITGAASASDLATLTAQVTTLLAQVAALQAGGGSGGPATTPGHAASTSTTTDTTTLTADAA